MARVLGSPARAGESLTVPGRWPVDLMIGGYLVATGVTIALYFREVPYAGWLLGSHAAALLLMILAVRHPRGMAVFRHWYPLPYVGACYKEMALLIPAIRHTDYDYELARLDYRLWGAHVSVWLERFQHPWLTEGLQVAYTLFVPCVLLVPVLLWRQRRYREFRYFAFLIALGFLASYIGYFLVPVRGPRFFLAHLQHVPLQGGWLFNAMQHMLDRLESAHYDCFPSGHTELTLIAWWGSRRISPRLFGAYTIYALLIVCATIYLRYHYTFDVLAGAVLAAVLLVAAPGAYRILRPEKADEGI
ncbi:MAG TPA: phosphatase PAP2 family protein [Bryobacteraceae bacterium]